MCTVIRKAQKYHPRTAKADIVVYKTTEQAYYESLDPNEFRSRFRRFVYKKDVVYETGFTYDRRTLVSDDVENEYRHSLKPEDRVYISKGFHSYATHERALQAYDDLLVSEFIIPQGAKYYRNDCGNVVSNKIMFRRHL